MKPSNSPENLGSEPPTGSERLICTTDLYDGTGDPWAGHERLKGLLAAFLNVELMDSPENFGEDPPTGSEIRMCKDQPIRWNRRPLSWTRQTKWLGVGLLQLITF